MRKIIVTGNWKMNKTIPEALDFVTSIKDALDTIHQVEVSSQ